MVGVPFERPAELAGRNEISDKEFAERQAQAKTVMQPTARNSCRRLLLEEAMAPARRHIGWNGASLPARRRSW